MPFTRPTSDRNAVTDGVTNGSSSPTVYVVIERWALDDPVDGHGWTIEAVHVTKDGAEGNLTTDQVGRERFIVAVETQR